jgi:hypothetical protein
VPTSASTIVCSLTVTTGASTVDGTDDGVIATAWPTRLGSAIE